MRAQAKINQSALGVGLADLYLNCIRDGSALVRLNASGIAAAAVAAEVNPPEAVEDGRIEGPQQRVADLLKVREGSGAELLVVEPRHVVGGIEKSLPGTPGPAGCQADGAACAGGGSDGAA